MANDANPYDALTFPKPKRAKKKDTRIIDQNYVRWVHGWPCCVPHCGRYPVHAHHAKTKGSGGSDRTCIPLCVDHHTGNYGVHHLGVITFEKTFGIDLTDLVTKYNGLYDNGNVGPKNHLVVKD